MLTLRPSPDTPKKQYKKQYNRKPTKLQARAFKIIQDNPELPLGKAMIMAGYSKYTTEAPGQNFLRTRGIKNMKSQWERALASRGINITTLAGKYAYLLDATNKIYSKYGDLVAEVPDNDIQFKTAEAIKKDLNLVPIGPGTEEKSVTFTWKKPSQ